MIDLLLRAGASPNVTDEYGTTILHRATQTTTDGEFIARCAAVVSDVNQVDSRGLTAVSEALEEWSPEPEGAKALDPLLALRAAGADLTRVVDRVPLWLFGPEGGLRSDAPAEAAVRLARLRHIVDARRSDFK